MISTRTGGRFQIRIGIALLLSLLFTGKADGHWLDLVNQHRDDIRAGLEHRPQITRRAESIILLQNPVPQELEFNVRRNLLGDILLLRWESEWREDGRLIGILVAALTDAHSEIGGRAYATLETSVPRRLLAPHAASIKAALHEIKWRKSERLLALLPLNQQERADLLAKPGLDRQVRARLGDTAAETELIQAFHAERDWGRKAGLAYLLGYVGTQRAGEALVRDLKSDIMRRTDNSAESIRVPIISALKEMHENEPLFWEDDFATRRGDDLIDYPPAEARAFLDRVYAWAEAKYGIIPQGPEGKPLFAY